MWPGGPCPLAVLAGACQAPAATPRGMAASPGTSPPSWGLRSAVHGGGREEGRVESGSADVPFRCACSPYRNVLEAGVPRPGEGDARRPLGGQARDPPPPIHIMTAITDRDPAPLAFPLMVTTPQGWCNLNPALFPSKSELLSSSLQNIKESRSYTK